MSDEMREAFERECNYPWSDTEPTILQSPFVSGYRAATAASDAKYLPVIEKLVKFVKELSENESSPSETIADNGMTVWDGYQECAKGLLHIAATVMKGGKCD